MDSKGLFDALDNDLLQDDRKSALEVPIIEEFMRRTMCRPRWCPHNRNAADAMTKLKGAHSEPLYSRCYALVQLYDKLKLYHDIK